MGTLNLTGHGIAVVVKRMLTKAEAANHCGRPVKRFEAECPVSPVRFSDGALRWDLRDLDGWLDTLKGGERAGEADDIIARLG